MSSVDDENPPNDIDTCVREQQREPSAAPSSSERSLFGKAILFTPVFMGLLFVVSWQSTSVHSFATREPGVHYGNAPEVGTPPRDVKKPPPSNSRPPSEVEPRKPQKQTTGAAPDVALDPVITEVAAPRTEKKTKIESPPEDPPAGPVATPPPADGAKEEPREEEPSNSKQKKESGLSAQEVDEELLLSKEVDRTRDLEVCNHRRTLYMGHSHVMRLRVAHCALLGDKCKPYIVGAGEPYLDPPALRRFIKSGGGGKHGKGFRTIVLSSWAWDLIHHNSDPTVPHDRIMGGLKLAMTYLQRRDPKAGPDFETPKILVTLPHFHRNSSHESRRPCQADHRVRLYSRAVEAAAFEFKLQLDADARKARAEKGDDSSNPPQPAAEVLVLDLYNWTKQLNHGSLKRSRDIADPWHEYSKPFVANSTWADGGDNDYAPDGGHLRTFRNKEIALALLERGIICDPSTPKFIGPRALSKERAPGLVRSPRDTRDYLKPILVSGNDGGGYAASIVKAKHGKHEKIYWPGFPSCEGRQFESDSFFFWGNMRVADGWSHESTFSKFRTDLANFLERKKYPRPDILRHQVLQVLRTVKGHKAAPVPVHGAGHSKKTQFATFKHSKVAPFEEVRYLVTECLNNVGLDENSTSWSRGSQPSLPGNTDYIMWRRRVTSRHERTSQFPPTHIPTCVCANKTHLLDAVHAALLNQAQELRGSQEESTLSDEIGRYCGWALSGFVTRNTEEEAGE